MNSRHLAIMPSHMCKLVWGLLWLFCWYQQVGAIWEWGMGREFTLVHIWLFFSSFSRWTLCLGSLCINYKNCLCRCVGTLASLSTLCALFTKLELNEEGALKERRKTWKRMENKKIMLKKKQFCKLLSFFTVIIITEYSFLHFRFCRRHMYNCIFQIVISDWLKQTNKQSRNHYKNNCSIVKKFTHSPNLVSE